MNEEFNERLVELIDELMAKNWQRPMNQRYTTLRARLIEILTEHTDDNGKISRRQINNVLKEMQKALDEFGVDFEEELRIMVESIAEQTTSGLLLIGTSVLGVALFNASSQQPIVDNVVKSQIIKKQADLLNLSDRVWNLTGDMHAELTKVVRADILRQTPVNQMIKNVRAVHDNEMWKIKRMVTTEANTAHRTATGLSALESDVVMAIRIVENHSKHKNHTQHECYKLAQQDRYGLGKGVYEKKDYALLAMPHPQCTSYIEYVLDEEVL